MNRICVWEESTVSVGRADPSDVVCADAGGVSSQGGDLPGYEQQAALQMCTSLHLEKQLLVLFLNED